MKPHGILEAALYAEDLEAAERFYTRVLRLEVITPPDDRHVFFRCGQGVLLVFNPRVTSAEATAVAGQAIPLHGSAGAGHLAFHVRGFAVRRV